VKSIDRSKAARAALFGLIHEVPIPNVLSGVDPIESPRERLL
jgi:hypothetical protein